MVTGKAKSFQHKFFMIDTYTPHNTQIHMLKNIYIESEGNSNSYNT